MISAPTAVRAAAAFGAVAALTLCAPPGSASAHDEDPTAQVFLDSVTPALPGVVTVQVRTGVSEQMLVANPTARVLEIRDSDQTGFLRVSSAGVFGNEADPFLQVSFNPPDSPVHLPSFARRGAAARWVKLADSDSWGWFEPRLRPDLVRADDVAWQIPMHYADQDVVAAGVVEHQTLNGAFETDADHRSDGLVATVAQGRPPAMFLRVPNGHDVVILGSDKLPFLRFDSAGVYANPASANLHENPQLASGPVVDGWIRVNGPGAEDWVDDRLQYYSDGPPGGVAKAGHSVDLAAWRIPMEVDGRADALTGLIRWRSANDLASLGRPHSAIRWWWPAAAALTAAVVGLGALRLRRRMGAPGPDPLAEGQPQAV